MRPALFALLGLSLVLMLAATPPASACHLPPTPDPSACTDWPNPPFGAVPFLVGCASSVEDASVVYCQYAVDLAAEILFGCPPNQYIIDC